MAFDRALAHLLVRLISGLIWLMAGWWKCFVLGPVAHAERFFAAGFETTWLPHGLRMAVGTAVPIAELLGGALLLLGLRVRVAAVLLGAVLAIVTYGHLLLEPLYDTTSHIFPRTVLLVTLLLLPRDEDRWSLDALLRRRHGAP